MAGIILVNTNMMSPPIGPIGLDYMAGFAKQEGIEVDVVDLCLTSEPEESLSDYFGEHSPELVAVSFRNVDDSFWPSAEWFVPELAGIIESVRGLSDAPVVIGGVGYSIFPVKILEHTKAEFGVRGDGERAIVALLKQLRGSRNFEQVPGLHWREDGRVIGNRPAWPEPISLPTSRDVIDNKTYFLKGGQCGLETKRGCNRKCVYCADHLAKGKKLRLRQPAEVADEAEALLAEGIDVLHICDSEFNVPRAHGVAICEEFVRRGIAERLRWYTYMVPVPFDGELARLMRAAGCVGIDFTGDSASGMMLNTYRQEHLKEDMATAVRLCHEDGISVMIDLLLGGPGETRETVAETINYMKQIGPDCVGASLGVRIYPGTQMATKVLAEGPLGSNPCIRRKYTGTVDFFRPTFYMSRALGDEPAELVRDLIAGDKRFFEPALDEEIQGAAPGQDHNYNANVELVKAIESGARGAYWDILRKLRQR